MTPADRAVLDGWWREFVATGKLPRELPMVQGRLVRAVHRGQLPSGPVHVKVMTFPRAKDRLRYLLRALPAEHEANMLRRLLAAGIACPEVVEVRVARRRGLPFRSLLVLRTLPVATAAAVDPADRLQAEAILAQRLLAAGIVHPDLHTDNFLRLTDGRLAVIDLQSARAIGPVRAQATNGRLRVAARLCRDRDGLSEAQVLAVLCAAGLVRDDAEAAELRHRVARERASFRRSRVGRCLCESTEFTVRWRWSGREFRVRGAAADGQWHHGGRELRRAWIGQRILQLDAGRPLGFLAYFEKWWWLGRKASLYVAPRCSGDRFHAELREATDAWSRSLPPS